MAPLGNLSSLATLILSVSLATERVVAIAKTIMPSWLADEKKTAALETDLVADKGRRIRVMGVALLSSLVTAALIGDTSSTWLMIPTHVVASDGTRVPTILVALLASGGSAFWTSIISYASAAKDIKTQQRSAEGLQYRADAERSGVSPVDTGMAARAKSSMASVVTTAPAASISSGEATLAYAGGIV